MNLYVTGYGLMAVSPSKSSPGRRFIQTITTNAFLMRVTILAILLTVSGLLLARDGSGQDLDKVMVSVQFRNSTLKQALRNIEGQTKLSFSYKTNDIAPYSNINYEADRIAVSKLLFDLLQSTDLVFEQVNSNIVIKKTKKNGL